MTKLSDISNKFAIDLVENASAIGKRSVYQGDEYVNDYIGLSLQRSYFYGRLIGDELVPLDLNKTIFNTPDNVILLIEGPVPMGSIPVNIGGGSLIIRGFGLIHNNETILLDNRGGSGGSNTGLQKPDVPTYSALPNSALDNQLFFVTDASDDPSGSVTSQWAIYRSIGDKPAGTWQKLSEEESMDVFLDYTFTNGLNKIGGDVKLGGDIIEDVVLFSTTNKNLTIGDVGSEVGNFIARCFNGFLLSINKTLGAFGYDVTDNATHTFREHRVKKTNNTTTNYDESVIYQSKDSVSFSATKTATGSTTNVNTNFIVSNTSIIKTIGTHLGTTYSESTSSTETAIDAPTGKGLKVTSATQSNITWATDDDYVPTIGKIKANSDPKLDTQDIWQETILQSNNLSFVTGGAITSGTIASSTFGGWSNGVVFKSTAVANTGYRIHLENFIYLGVTDKKFKLQYRINSSIIKLTMGFFNTLSGTTASTNAVKFEVLNMVGTLTTTDTSTSSVNVTTYTHTVNTIYTLIMEINAAGTSANVKIYDGTNSTPVLDITNTTNIPTGSGKTMYVGAKGTYNGTPPGITDLCEIGRFGIGDISGYLRDKGKN